MAGRSCSRPVVGHDGIGMAVTGRQDGVTKVVKAGSFVE